MSALRNLRLRVADAAKRIVRPITSRRFLIEKARYRGRTILSDEAGNAALRDSLASGIPAAAGKIGGTEIVALNRWLTRRLAEGELVRNWAGADVRVHRESGVYPIEPELMSRFADFFLSDLGELDFLAAWYRFGEAAITRRFAPEATLVELRALEPYYHKSPWSAALAGKRVLVFTPFAASVERQYARRREIWKSKPDVLPDFTLLTLRAPLYPHMIAPSFPTWFDALDEFKRQIDAIECDVVITGAGAWSVPLAVHAKRRGRWGIHLGGATQILFGIRGKRWDAHPQIGSFFNDAWVRPGDDERPANFREMENGCYW